MLPQKRQWCRSSSNEKLARHSVHAVAELSGTQAGLLELAFTLATIFPTAHGLRQTLRTEECASGRDSGQRAAAAPRRASTSC